MADVKETQGVLQLPTSTFQRLLEFAQRGIQQGSNALRAIRADKTLFLRQIARHKKVVEIYGNRASNGRHKHRHQQPVEAGVEQILRAG